jgi:hypothetical protein
MECLDSTNAGAPEGGWCCGKGTSQAGRDHREAFGHSRGDRAKWRLEPSEPTRGGIDQRQRCTGCVRSGVPVSLMEALPTSQVVTFLFDGSKTICSMLSLESGGVLRESVHLCTKTKDCYPVSVSSSVQIWRNKGAVGRAMGGAGALGRHLESQTTAHAP